MNYFAVIDVETSWDNEVMSIGVVVAATKTFQWKEIRYYVIDPVYRTGGMFAYALRLKGKDTVICKRKDAIANLINVLQKYDVTSIFAYNAKFDYTHLPELHSFTWYDIMQKAAYRQYNHAIPSTAQCCSTGRLKSGYSVEKIMRMLKGLDEYCETHNALLDAYDELEIMKLLKIDVSEYESLI